MKKLLEFGVFDILKDPKNEEFLDKVKKENRDLYPQFLNILKRKGLEVAMKEYETHDPNYIKIMQKRDKKEKALINKHRTKEFKEEVYKTILASHKEKTDEIQKVLSSTILKNLGNSIDKFKNISEYLTGCKTKKQYTNKFNEILKHPLRISYELDREDINIDSLSFLSTYYNYYDGERDQTNVMIRIEQFYSLKDKKSTFSIYYGLYPEGDFDEYDKWSTYIPTIDAKKVVGYLYSRKKYAKEHFNIEKGKLNEIYESLSKLDVLLDEEFYNKWFEDYDMKQNAKKYNIF